MEHHLTGSQLRSVTCHMQSHSVTFYPTQVNTPRFHPSQSASRLTLSYVPRKDGRLSLLLDLGDLLQCSCYIQRWFTRPQTVTHPIVATGPGVD